MTEHESLTFRPPWYLHAFSFIVTVSMLMFALLIVGPVIPVPVWVRAIFVGGAGVGVLLAVATLFSYVRITPQGIEQRTVRRAVVPWSQVEAWSQFGSGHSVCFRTSDGRVHSFASSCVYGKRSDQVAAVLEARVGPPKTGADAVLPRWVKAMFSSFGSSR